MIIENLRRAKLLKRYKRFLADVEFADGSIDTVHCPNPGSMIGCSEADSVVYVSTSDNPKRKLRHTLLVVLPLESGEPSLPVVVDTSIANKLVKQTVVENLLETLSGYAFVRGEPRYEKGRFDLLLASSEDSQSPKESCLVEIKSTTLSVDGVAMFPDARTERGRKHLTLLSQAKSEGYRAVQFFLVNRQGTSKFAPARHIDPEYSDALAEAAAKGVEIFAHESKIEISEQIGQSDVEPLYKLSLDLGREIEVEI